MVRCPFVRARAQGGVGVRGGVRVVGVRGGVRVVGAPRCWATCRVCHARQQEHRNRQHCGPTKHRPSKSLRGGGGGAGALAGVMSTLMMAGSIGEQEYTAIMMP
jgi:hypothetical protein